MIHLVFVKIHPWNDGNGRSARLMEKWFLAQKLDEKAWFIESESVTTTSLVSVPVMVKGVANCPVTTHDPAGIGDVAAIGFGTVVAFAGACPEEE